MMSSIYSPLCNGFKIIANKLIRVVKEPFFVSYRFVVLDTKSERRNIVPAPDRQGLW